MSFNGTNTLTVNETGAYVLDFHLCLAAGSASPNIFSFATNNGVANFASMVNTEGELISHQVIPILDAGTTIQVINEVPVAKTLVNPPDSGGLVQQCASLSVHRIF
ncbi:hypothetical protein M3Y14_29550 [Bacillus thuringiensis]|uniref:hypothetical protein n=1 Tax=Bacillus thuringiensis TaxID=1428 RepID=UPI0022242407|nr:hypothetical protein [Bacillus thuringiensis]UYX52478.1 hypothetical protein M3Y14_29550 [Bacillus thuringiensis]